jgi:superfamily II DNA or RNA helicase
MQEVHNLTCRENTGIAVGTAVLARRRRWRVVDIEPGADCSIVRLSRDEGAGPPLALIAPFDLIQPVECSRRVRTAHRRAAAAAAAAAILDSHPWSAVPSALHSDIRVLDFQLEPALAMLRGECTRLLLADEVGLGKTIQAALIVNELRSRHEAERVLIVTPPGLRDQWHRELHERCGMVVRRVDAASLARDGSMLPPWIDPWSLPGVSVVSIDLVKRAEILAQLAQILWDVIVIDEAHHAARSTDRGGAAAELCGRSRYAVLITATPHGGDSPGFEHLLRIGELDGDRSRMKVFRRGRADVGLSSLPRRSRAVRVIPTGEEHAMHQALDRYTRRVWREAGDSPDARLAMIVLRKRALSSPAALALSADRRLRALDPTASSATQLPLAFDDFNGERIADDGDPLERGLGGPGLRDLSAERAMLERVRDAACHAEGRHAKLRTLVRALGRSGEPVIVFTEYRDTLEHLERQLRATGQAMGLARQEPEIACLHGGLVPGARAAALDAFARGGARILLATDAAAEGLNLHHRCRWVIHFELPWSTVRLEQRTGRVDRIGQRRRVHAWSLVNARTDEERVLARLDARRVLGEEEVAKVVFGERPLPSPAGEMRVRQAPAGHREARRLTVLGSLRTQPLRGSGRAMRAAVRRRGPFASLPTGNVVLFRAICSDGNGQRIAAECLAVAGLRRGSGTPRAVKRLLGRRLARSIADKRRFVRVGIRRADALERRVRADLPKSVQGSLFDRRAEQAADSAQLRASEALGRVRHATARAAAGLRDVRTSIGTVAVFEVR